MQGSPLVSVIIPTFNASNTLRKALESVKAQTYGHVEVLIIDGASTDDTVVIAKEFLDQFKKIKIVSEKDNGIYDAMNKGIKLATGEWLYFLGSDDYLYSFDVLEKVFSNELSDVDVVYGNVFSPFFNGVYDHEFTVDKLLLRNICHQAIFLRKRVFELVGTFNIKYRLHADWDHNLRWFLSKDIKKKFVDIIVAYYAEGGMSSVSAEPFFYRVKQWKFLLYNKKNISVANKLRITRSELIKAIKDRRRRDVINIVTEFPLLFF